MPDWDLLQRLFAAIAMPCALAIGWLLKQRAANRQATQDALAGAAKRAVDAQLAEVEAAKVAATREDAASRREDVATQAARVASALYRDLLADVHAEVVRLQGRALEAEATAARQAERLHAVEGREEACQTRVARLEAACRAAGLLVD